MENQGGVQCSEELVQTLGIPWTPMEFVKQAAMAKHPMQLNQLLPKRLGEVISVHQNFLCPAEDHSKDLKAGVLGESS